MGVFTDLRDKIQLEKEKSIIEHKLFEKDRLSTAGEIAAGVAHEINNPLGTV